LTILDCEIGKNQEITKSRNQKSRNPKSRNQEIKKSRNQEIQNPKSKKSK